MRVSRCISCGCTEDRACPVKIHGIASGCFWVLLNEQRREGLCSACATVPQAVYALIARPHFSPRMAGWTTEELATWLNRAQYTIAKALQQLSRKKLVRRVGTYWQVTA